MKKYIKFKLKRIEYKNMDEKKKIPSDDNPKIENTQGHIKLQQYVDDLKRNKHFLAKVKKIKKILVRKGNKSIWDGQAAKLKELLKKMELQIADVEDGMSEVMLETDNLIYEIAEEYGLDCETISLLFLYPEIFGKDLVEKNGIPTDFDFCTITDNYDEELTPLVDGSSIPTTLPVIANINKQSHIRAFPLSIDIHKFATKRDVLDFIEKKWPHIEDYLNFYRNEKKVRFRKRKYLRQITDFIWENRSLSWKEIKDKMDKVHPNNGIVYYEIGKILSNEKKRRLGKIIKGQ